MMPLIASWVPAGPNWVDVQVRSQRLPSLSILVDLRRPAAAGTRGWGSSTSVGGARVAQAASQGCAARMDRKRSRDAEIHRMALKKQSTPKRCAPTSKGDRRCRGAAGVAVERTASGHISRSLGLRVPPSSLRPPTAAAPVGAVHNTLATIRSKTGWRCEAFGRVAPSPDACKLLLEKAAQFARPWSG